MYFYGSFLTQLGETVTVHIVTENSRAQQVEIGDEKSGVFFTTNPVEIESSVNDTFDHLLRSQATIRLLTRDFIPDFFCTSCMDAVVNIFKGDKCIFAGFIEPQAYSQSYNEVYDELEISCIDVLSALQYSSYRNVGSFGVSHEAVKANAGQRLFSEIVSDILNSACASIDITGAGNVKYFYDGSKALTANANRYGIFTQLAIPELLFLGDEENDVWPQDKVLTSLLKYLNLHIVQDGLEFYIFSWESVKSTNAVTWRELTTNMAKTTTKNCIAINAGNAASNDTTISIGEVYNRISLSCDLAGAENLIESPLDTDALTSPYTNKQKYMTEYSSDGEGITAWKAFYDMLHGQVNDWKDAAMTDWYIQVKDNPSWHFPLPGTGQDIVAAFCRDNTNQQALPNYLAAESRAAIIAIGKVEHDVAQQDNSPVSKVDMKDYLIVSVNGNGIDTDEQKTFPNDDSLKAGIPYAVYNGSTSGGVYSPADDDTVNYIVLSGKIILSPLMGMTDNYASVYRNGPRDFGLDNPYRYKTVPSRKNGDGRYYTQRYYRAETPRHQAVDDSSITQGLVPFTDTGEQKYEFKYSAAGDKTDNVSKVAVLACMLIIGDKCVVETGTDGKPSDLNWHTYKTREQCADDDEYYQQSFTIGFNPKIGDKLIGTSFDIQNNIDLGMGLEVEGTAIPIRRGDKVGGAVKFIILGPVNTVWDEVTRRHPTFFRHTKWGLNSVPLLAHVSSILLESFEIKVYSDNGLINNHDSSDLVYVSDTQETFVNEKNDITFEINSALTAEERNELNVPNTICLSTPLDGTTGHGVVSIYDHNKKIQAKPEQNYVDSYYDEYHLPRVIMSQKIEDTHGLVGLFNHYSHPAMGCDFFVQGISRNLIEGYAELTLKQLGQ